MSMYVRISIDDYHEDNEFLAKLIKEVCPDYDDLIFFVDLKDDTAVEQIRRLHAMGRIDIGGHTINHPSDMKLLSDEDLKIEVQVCYDKIREVMGQKPWHFAYTRGRHDERVRAAVKAAGFRFGRTTIVNQVTFDDDVDPFQSHTAIHAYQRMEYDGEPWDMRAKRIIDTNPEYFHIWGHAFELGRPGELARFVDVLNHLNKKICENLGC